MGLIEASELDAVWRPWTADDIIVFLDENLGTIYWIQIGIIKQNNFWTQKYCPNDI